MAGSSRSRGIAGRRSARQRAGQRSTRATHPTQPPEKPSAAAPSPAWRSRLEEKLRLLPARPGVYLLKDGRGRILYVGKAKRLPSRVRSYFRASPALDPRLANLRERVRDLEYVVTANETEALLLEANLIKSHRPYYNVELKDDKQYPFLRVNLGHRFPRAEVTRRVVADGSRYFGPFTRVRDLRQILKSLRRIFPLRSCSDRRLAQGGRECLDYFIGLCRAPCTERIDAAAYGQLVQELVRFLDGGGAELVAEWRGEMERLAREMRFEDSARLRDDIARLRRLQERQRVVDRERPDLDVVGLCARGDQALARVFSHRGGAVVGTWRLTLRRVAAAGQDEVMEALLTRHYQERRQVPPEVLVGALPRNREVIERWLAGRAGRRVHIRRPQRGRGAQLLRAAQENAHLALEEQELIAAGRRARIDQAVYALQEALALPAPPRRIEGYDISTLQGRQAVGSRVLFTDGRPRRSGYRRYRIRTVAGADDFAMLGEVLERRLARLAAPGEEEPDLILVDGGRGQVSRAAQVLAAAGRGDLPLIGLAKREEEIFARGARQPLRLPRSSPALQLLQRVRDEAHRFAIDYHRRLRRGFLRHSPLDAIPGLGRQRARALMDRFRTLAAVRRADLAALQEVPGIGPALAARITAALHPGSRS